MATTDEGFSPKGDLHESVEGHEVQHQHEVHGEHSITETEDSSASPATQVREQDRYLPIANINKIMKKSLPGNAKIAKEAKSCVQECVSEFISFITSEANDHCQTEKRKTINGDDIIYSLGTLSFDAYVEPLKRYLTKYREVEGEKISPGKNSRNKSYSFAQFQTETPKEGELDTDGKVESITYTT